MKKFLALLLALLMVLSVGIVAFADSDPEGTEDPPEGEEEIDDEGSITINNAEIGKTYAIYKIFDAHVLEDGGVSYSTDDTDIIAAIKADQAKTDKDADGNPVAAGSVCPFMITGELEGTAYVMHKPNFSESVGRGWIKNHLSLFEKVDEVEAESSIVVFDELELGYYLMMPSEGTIASVNTTTPDVVINDKNPRTPADPQKSTDTTNAQVGEDIPFTITFKATNFLIEGTIGSYSEIVKQYVITEKPVGLSGATITSVKYYAASDYDATTKKIKAGSTGTEIADYTQNSEDHTLTIPWAKNTAEDGEDPVWESLYPSPVYVEILFTMKMDASVLDISNERATNTYDLEYYVGDETEPHKVPNVPTVDVYTTSLSIHKTDGTGVLDGAYFDLYKIDDDGNYSYYTFNDDGEVEWVAGTKQEYEGGIGDHYLADNDFATKEFKGLEEGTYYLHEIMPPPGYKPLASDPVIVITYNENATQADEEGTPATIPFDVTVDGEKISENSYQYFSVEVVNTKGEAMPATGGAGTTLLIATGSILFVGMAILLVTKKRLYNEG